jgi:hypothetical protein
VVYKQSSYLYSRDAESVQTNGRNRQPSRAMAFQHGARPRSIVCVIYISGETINKSIRLHWDEYLIIKVGNVQLNALVGMRIACILLFRVWKLS